MLNNKAIELQFILQTVIAKHNNVICYQRHLVSEFDIQM